MKNLTVEAGLPEPQVFCQSGEVTVRFTLYDKESGHLQTKTEAGDSSDLVENEHPLSIPVRNKRLETVVLRFLEKESLSITQVSKVLGQMRPSGSLSRLFKRLLDKKFIELTMPDKPKSKHQKYQITQNGRDAISKKEDKD